MLKIRIMIPLITCCALSLILTGCGTGQWPTLDKLLDQINYKTVGPITSNTKAGDGVDSNSRSVIYNSSAAYTTLTQRFTKLGYTCTENFNETTERGSTCQVNSESLKTNRDIIDASIAFKATKASTHLTVSIP